jgi:hypothetical protein
VHTFPTWEYGCRSCRFWPFIRKAFEEMCFARRSRDSSAAQVGQSTSRWSQKQSFRYCRRPPNSPFLPFSSRFPALRAICKESSGVEIPLRDVGIFSAERSLLYLPIYACF